MFNRTRTCHYCCVNGNACMYTYFAAKPPAPPMYTCRDRDNVYYYGYSRVQRWIISFQARTGLSPSVHLLPEGSCVIQNCSVNEAVRVPEVTCTCCINMHHSERVWLHVVGKLVERCPTEVGPSS